MPRKSAKEEVSDVFEIKALHSYESRNGKDYFLVEWEGYPMSDATWEPRSNFMDPTPAIVARMTQLKSEAKATKEPTRKSAAGAAGASGGAQKRRRAGSVSPEESSSSRSSKTTKVAEKVPKSTTAAGAPSSTPSPTRSSKRGRSSTSSVSGVPPITLDSLSTVPRPTVGSSRSQRDDAAQPSGVSRTSPSPASRSTSAAATSAAGFPPMYTTPTPQAKASSSADIPLVDEAPANIIRVRSIRAVDKGKRMVAVVTLPGQVEQYLRVPLESIRRTHPQMLIDFLVDRIQFRPSVQEK